MTRSVKDAIRLTAIGLGFGLLFTVLMRACTQADAQPTPRVQQLFNECVNEAGFTFRQCVWLQGVMGRYGIR